MSKEAPIELLLSILVAISIGFALERLINPAIPDILWFGFSIIAILIAVGFIYAMLDTFPIKNKFNDFSKLLVILLVVFFPFTLVKSLENSISTPFDWNGNKEIMYSIIMGLIFALWGVSEIKPKDKVKGVAIIIIGVVIIIISFAFWLMLEGGLISKLNG